MNPNYHHGDLRNALIEAGIQLVYNEGAQALSIRKVAKLCGVSHAAPHHHFKDKDSLLLAMQEHISNKFAQKLKTVANSNIENPEILHELGKAYLSFFLDNPYFHNLVFNQMDHKINLHDVKAVNYPPFDVFKNCAVAVMEEIKIPESKWMQNVAAMWLMVHGVTSWAVTESVNHTEEWHQLLEKMMDENFIFAASAGGMQ